MAAADGSAALISALGSFDFASVTGGASGPADASASAVLADGAGVGEEPDDSTAGADSRFPSAGAAAIAASESVDSASFDAVEFASRSSGTCSTVALAGERSSLARRVLVARGARRRTGFFGDCGRCGFSSSIGWPSVGSVINKWQSSEFQAGASLVVLLAPAGVLWVGSIFRRTPSPALPQRRRSSSAHSARPRCLRGRRRAVSPERLHSHRKWAPSCPA